MPAILPAFAKGYGGAGDGGSTPAQPGAEARRTGAPPRVGLDRRRPYGPGDPALWVNYRRLPRCRRRPQAVRAAPASRRPNAAGSGT